VVDPPRHFEGDLARRVETAPGEDYRRYEVTADGVSPMTLPGTPNGMYTADGLEHAPSGTPSSQAAHHAQQLAKRLAKLLDFDYGPDWAQIEGDGPDCILTWGSAAGAVREAASRLRSAGRPVRVIALRLIMPLRRLALIDALEGALRVLVVEQNQGAQLFRHLHAEQALPPCARSFARPGPLPLRPGEIVAAVLSEEA
jgi:2-oxoglutarate ferredoxin oxidoreductase subunit alpha